MVLPTNKKAPRKKMVGAFILVSIITKLIVQAQLLQEIAAAFLSFCGFDRKLN
jgi:hypothetical protein